MPEIEIILAQPEQEPILANMLELYVHDFSEIIDIKLGEDGRFGYKHLHLYWTESNRYPFLVFCDSHLAGFVFVCQGSRISNQKDVWDMAEFFIVRGFRRLGVGTKVAQWIWKKFPGKWEVRVIERNKKAIDFWASAISEYTGKKVEPVIFSNEEQCWQVFTFETIDIA